MRLRDQPTSSRGFFSHLGHELEPLRERLVRRTGLPLI